MGNKVTLTYEEGRFTVGINGSIVDIDKDLESSISKFKNVIRNNVNSSERSWLFIEESIRTHEHKDLEINGEFKTITLGSLKYFYNTGKLFYNGNSSMVPLMGGYELVKFILQTEELKDSSKLESFLELCKLVVENKATYRTGEEHIVVLSPALSYGSVEYNFNTKRMNKGVAIEHSNFEDFKEFVMQNIKR